MPLVGAASLVADHEGRRSSLVGRLLDLHPVSEDASEDTVGAGSSYEPGLLGGSHG